MMSFSYRTAEQWARWLSSHWRTSLLPHTAQEWHNLIQKTIHVVHRNILSVTFVLNIHTQEQLAFTFSLGADGAAEGAVLVFNEVAAENDILTSPGIFTPNPDTKKYQKSF